MSDPIGAQIRVTSLDDIADVLEALGGHCISDIVRNDDGTLLLGYQFD
jgi:hypothetical protein